MEVLSQKLHGGAPGRSRQVARCCPKTANFLPQNSLFLAQNTAPSWFLVLVHTNDAHSRPFLANFFWPFNGHIVES